MTTYSVDPDGEGNTTLWRAEGTEDPRPLALLFLDLGGDTHTYAGDHGVVFRAAAAVLAPDEAVVDLVVQAIFKPETVLPRIKDPYESLPTWQARAVAAALRAHVEEATP